MLLQLWIALQHTHCLQSTQASPGLSEGRETCHAESGHPAPPRFGSVEPRPSLRAQRRTSRRQTRPESADASHSGGSRPRGGYKVLKWRLYGGHTEMVKNTLTEIHLLVASGTQGWFSGEGGDARSWDETKTKTKSSAHVKTKWFQQY